MPKQNDTFSKLLQMISDEEFNRFAVEYAMKHPEMVEEMEKKYRKLLKGTKEVDIDKEVAACFVTEKTPRGYYRRSWEPDNSGMNVLFVSLSNVPV